MTLVQVNRIIEAVKPTVLQEMWVALVNKLDRPEQHPCDAGRWNRRCR
jgi:hypothetical protein